MAPTLVTLKYFSLLCINFSFVHSYFRRVSPKEIASLGITFYPEGYELPKSQQQPHLPHQQFLHKYSVIDPTTTQNLASFEQNIIFKGLANLTHGNEHDPFYNSVQEYIEDFEDSLEERVDANVMKLVAGNPLSVYRMVYRFRNYIQPWTLGVKMTQKMRSPLGEKVTDYLRSVYKTTDGPDRRDVQIAMMTIIMIQYQGELTTAHIADGIFGGRRTGVDLKAVHCVDIGIHAVATRNYAIGEEWLQLAVSKSQQGDRTVHLDSAMMTLNKIKLINEKNKIAIGEEKVGNDGNLFENQIMNQRKADLKRKAGAYQFRVETGRNSNPNDNRIFDNVCRGHVEQSNAIKSRLFCWYEHQVDSTWRIRPMKAELHSRFPHFEIVQYYDVLDKKTMESIKAAVRPFWSPFKDSADSPVYTRVRVAAVVDEKVYPQEKLLSSLAERVSGLRSKRYASKPILLSYSPGGQFRVHRDGLSLNDTDDKFVHKVATCMFYLEEGRLGGETGFPYGRAAIRGVKGSAVIWYNMMPSGQVDLDTFHGSCPLILGEKYVALKWISYADQTHLKCPVDPNSRFEFLLNGKSKYCGEK